MCPVSRGFGSVRLRVPDEVTLVLHHRHDQYRHEASGTLPAKGSSSDNATCKCKCFQFAFTGIPLHILQGDHYVPGSSSRCDSQQFQNKPPVFKEILQVSEELCLLYFKRCTQAGLEKEPLNPDHFLSTSGKKTLKKKLPAGLPAPCSSGQQHKTEGHLKLPFSCTDFFCLVLQPCSEERTT